MITSTLMDKVIKAYQDYAPRIRATARRTGSGMCSKAYAAGNAVSSISEIVGQLNTSHPSAYHSLIAGLKGAGAFTAWQLFEFTPEMIDRILDVPQYYIAALAAGTSLSQIHDRKARVVLNTIIPALGGLASYFEGVELLADIASLSPKMRERITNTLYSLWPAALGLIGKYSLNAAAEKPKTVDGRTVIVRPSEEHKALDTGLNALILYSSVKVIVEDSLTYTGMLPPQFSNALSHVSGGIASYKYAISSKMPRKAQTAAKLAIPFVAAYFIAESIGDGLYKASPSLRSTGEWITEQGKYYAALAAPALTWLNSHFKIGYPRTLRSNTRRSNERK